MSSQYQRQKANYDKYMSRPLYNPLVALEMRRQMQYANTIDVDAAREASDILNPTSLTSEHIALRKLANKATPTRDKG